MILRRNSIYFAKQHYEIGLCNGDNVLCLARTKLLIMWSKFMLEMGSEDSEKSKWQINM